MTKVRYQRGQMLIISVIVLSIILILGLILVGIVGRNVVGTLQSQRRSLASELADSGVRFAHQQLLHSELGADWRPGHTPIGTSTQQTRDPDALYLRISSGLAGDRGGPDGLGPYSRINFNQGRSLIRVRFAYLDDEPNDEAFKNLFREYIFLKKPKRGRGYLLIESVGRSGLVREQDPTTLLARAVTIRDNYTGRNSRSEFIKDFESLRLADRESKAETRKMVAFASIGLLETARYITNKNHQTRPAEIGCPINKLGAYSDNKPVNPIMQWSGLLGAQGLSSRPGASLWSNADLKIHGKNDVVLSPEYGDRWVSSGKIFYASSKAQLNLRHTANNAPFPIGPLVNNTQIINADGNAQPQNIAHIVRKEPPSMLRTRPGTNQNRYYALTRDSNATVRGLPVGQYGYGAGIYIDCPERGAGKGSSPGIYSDENFSLSNDWLNPGNPNSVGWDGPIYRPVASVIKLSADGFDITRDSRSQRPSWFGLNTQGQMEPTSLHQARFKTRFFADSHQAFIINDILYPNEFRALEEDLVTSFPKRLPFNGVIFCEGDVRVRGTIPTDVQLTIVSLGTIYIDGSITKGIVDHYKQLLNRQSRSSLMLMARDYVAINTTQFFAPQTGQLPLPIVKIRDQAAFELDQPVKPINIQAEWLLEPLPDSPPTKWQPYATRYSNNAFSEGEDPTLPHLLLFHSASQNGLSTFSLGIRPSENIDYFSYLFSKNTRIEDNLKNPLGSPILFGVDRPRIDAFPLLSGGSNYNNNIADRTLSPINTGVGDYVLSVQNETNFQIRLDYPKKRQPLQNYRLARAAINPHDIRIEASIYAEEGSFFIIPGNWFNTYSKDTRAYYNQKVSTIGAEQAQQERFEEFGHVPEAPFYGEPLNVRMTIFGSISENMPPSMGQQTEWLRKWGWMPYLIGATERPLPSLYIPEGYAPEEGGIEYVPNINLIYDPMLLSCKTTDNQPIRQDGYGNILPPMPRLPVSPTLAYYGEIRP